MPLPAFMSEAKNVHKNLAILPGQIVCIDARQPGQIIGVHGLHQKLVAHRHNLFVCVTEHRRALVIDVDVAPFYQVINEENTWQCVGDPLRKMSAFLKSSISFSVSIPLDQQQNNQQYQYVMKQDVYPPKKKQSLSEHVR